MKGMTEKVMGGCPIVQSPCQKIWNSETGYGWKGASIVRVQCKIGLMKYTSVNVKTTNGNHKREKFWNEVNICLRKLKSVRFTSKE